MATVTPNFNWPVPTSTDLVKDGATAIEALGDSIDASLVDLKGGTTGQVLSKASNTDMDFTWVTDAAGDIQGVTVTSPLTGGGTSGTVTVGILSGTTSNLGAVQLSDSTSSTSTTLAATANAVKTSYDLASAAIPKSTVTTAGDVIYATGSSAVTRLGVGSTGQVLTVAGGVPTWSTPAGGGGLTQIASTSLSGSSTTVSSIPGTYKYIYILITNVSTSSNGSITFTVNGASADYAYAGVNQIQATTNTTGSINDSAIRLSAGQTLDASTSKSAYTLTFNNYTATADKIFEAYGYTFGNVNNAVTNITGAWRDTSTITSCAVATSAGSFDNGTITVYGVN
jgi:hypothetical protein